MNPTAFDAYRVITDEYREVAEGRVLVLNHAIGRGKASGLDLARLEVPEKGANLFHIRDGKVTRLVLYWRAERAFADLGLTPEGEAVNRRD